VRTGEAKNRKMGNLTGNLINVKSSSDRSNKCRGAHQMVMDIVFDTIYRIWRARVGRLHGGVAF
jgi:hypothetical protein